MRGRGSEGVRSERVRGIKGVRGRWRGGGARGAVPSSMLK